jgi:GntR family transcriptional regulator
MEEIKDGPVAKWRQLAAILRNRIESGDLAPGDPLPSEVEIEQATGLARGTIRVAIRSLRDDGLIVTAQGKGSFVADVRPPAGSGE